MNNGELFCFWLLGFVTGGLATLVVLVKYVV
jgi:hypothetical protein